MRQSGVDRDALTGVAIAGGSGVGWTWWAAAGVSGDVATTMRVGGSAVGAVIIIGALARYRLAATRAAGDSIFRSRGYLVVVVAEVIALIGGNATLGAAGDGRYVAAWTAFVVGVHFIGFGRLFVAMFHWLGAAFVVAAVVGVIVGAATGAREDVETATGLIAATSLFTAGSWGLRAVSASGYGWRADRMQNSLPSGSRRTAQGTEP